ncbi:MULTISPECIES: YtxH domain-containing protein [Enterococcus]|uniref:YtxH domain-containing protein n=1 Tax=Enterococcus TaxID=1350 RepID=UPI00065E7F24|nr:MULTISPECIES: YtxH domain-containing protein [Enterococcus]KAF1303373.1 hypothetical protein BAU16_04790 [Enterococcus sp. JM9B]
MLKNFIKGLLFGSSVGAVGGLLLAPRSGNETRKKLAKELEEATDSTLELNESLQHFQRAVVETKRTAMETLPVLQNALQKDIEAYKFQAEPRIKQIQQQVAKLNGHVTQFTETLSEPSESGDKK